MSGRLKESLNFSKGILQGKAMNYFLDTGILESQGAYLGGFKNGKWLYYMVNGAIEKEITFNLGKQDGAFVLYGANGKKRVKGFSKSPELLVFTTGTAKGQSNKWAQPELKKHANKNQYEAGNDEDGSQRDLKCR